MMMINVTKGWGLSVRGVIWLTSVGRWMNVPIADWLAENGY